MALLECIDASTPICRVDPRARLLVCLPLIVLIALAQNLQMLTAISGAALVITLMLRIPLRVLRRRMLLVNAFLLLVWVSVPLAMRGPAGADAIDLALRATLKANTIMLLVTCLVSTIEVVTLGHALAHLRVPRKLVHLFLFTVRYTEVLHLEYERLIRAMKARAFRPGLNRATYRALAALAGMLLIRSLDRADRVIAAMKCRGFRGHFFLLHHFHFHRRDGWFGLTSALILLLLAYWEWA
jgi:cobalt/nickel transport system permease protein